MAYGHDLQSVSLPTTLPFAEQLEVLERFATEVIPLVRHAAPTTLWGPEDPFGARTEGVAPISTAPTTPGSAVHGAHPSAPTSSDHRAEPVPAGWRTP